MSRCWAGVITVLTLAFCAPSADATVMFSASGGGLSAQASFTISGGAGNRTLTILLTNTDAATGVDAPDVPSEVLTGLFWNLGSTTFTTGNATLVNGGEIIQTANCEVSCAGQTNVGGEFSYASGGVDWLAGTNQGIASSGYLNNNTSAGNFKNGAVLGTNYDNPAALDGINFGIVPDGWTAYSGNGGLDGVALVDGTVKFVLKIPDGLAEGDIKNVYFTYGTSANENTLHATTNGSVTTSGSTVPEPATLSMLGLAMAGLGYRLRRRKS